MVINWPSTFQFEPILFSKCICNCLGVLTRDAEVNYVDSNVLIKIVNPTAICAELEIGERV
jgi:hypothetical protein